MSKEISTLPDGTVRMCLTQERHYRLYLRQQSSPC